MKNLFVGVRVEFSGPEAHLTGHDHRVAAERFGDHVEKRKEHGDTERLEQLFTADVASFSDGNGIRSAARIPVFGVGRVAKFVAAFAGHFWRGKGIEWVEVNGAPAVALSEDGVITTVLTLTASSDGIRTLLWIMSPDKLRHVTIGGE